MPTSCPSVYTEALVPIFSVHHCLAGSTLETMVYSEMVETSQAGLGPLPSQHSGWVLALAVDVCLLHGETVLELLGNYVLHVCSNHQVLPLPLRASCCARSVPASKTSYPRHDGVLYR